MSARSNPLLHDGNYDTISLLSLNKVQEAEASTSSSS